MANIKKLQEAFDYMLNEEDDAADQAMHEYFVSLAREINEQFEDAELDEADMEDDLTKEIESDMSEIDNEEGVLEDDDEFVDMSDDEEDLEGGEDDFDFDGSGDLDDHEEEHSGIEGKLEDLEDTIEELRAEFQRLTGDEDELDLGDEGDFDLEDDSEEELVEMSDDEAEDDLEGDFDLEDDEEEVREDLEDLEEALELEKVTLPSNSEGQEVGKGGKNFTPNTTQNLKPKGNLETPNAKPQTSKGGEAKGHKPLNQQKFLQANQA